MARRPKMVHSFRATVAEARRHGDLYFAALLSQDRIQKAFGVQEALARLDLYACRDGMGLSLAMPQPRPFLPRCRGAARLPGVWRGVSRRARPTPEPIARHETICRKKPFMRWCETPASRSRTNRRTAWLWHGRKVRVVDGSTITMPDTPENQAAYPQPETQKPGCGFPIARILVIFSLSVGTVLEAAIGKYQGQADRRKQFVSRALRGVERRRRYPCGPLFQRLVRHCLPGEGPACPGAGACCSRRPRSPWADRHPVAATGASSCRPRLSESRSKPPARTSWPGRARKPPPKAQSRKSVQNPLAVLANQSYVCPDGRCGGRDARP